MKNEKHIYFYRNLDNEFIQTDKSYLDKKILFRSQSGDLVYCLNHHRWEKYKECTSDGFTTITDEHFEGFVVNYCSAKYIWQALDSYEIDISKNVKDKNGIQFATIFFDIETDYYCQKVRLWMYYIGREKYSDDTRTWFDNVQLKSRSLEYYSIGENNFIDYGINAESIPKNVLSEFINQIGDMYKYISNISVDTNEKGLDFIEELNLLPVRKMAVFPDMHNPYIYVSKTKKIGEKDDFGSDDNCKLFNSIQEAIDSASDDDTIIIYDDGYYHEDLVINKRIKITTDWDTVKIIPKTEAGIKIEGDCILERLIITNAIPTYMTKDSEVIKTKHEYKSPLVTIRNSKPVFDNCTIYKANGIGVYVENAAPEFYKCNIVRSIDANILITGKSVVEITESVICYSKESNGVEMSGDAKVRIERTEIFMNARSGIKATDNSSGKIIDTRIHENKEYGFEDHSEGYVNKIPNTDNYWNGKDSYRDFYNNPL